jgi:hypothetical protein
MARRKSTEITEQRIDRITPLFSVGSVLKLFDFAFGVASAQSADSLRLNTYAGGGVT